MYIEPVLPLVPLADAPAPPAVVDPAPPVALDVDPAPPAVLDVDPAVDPEPMTAFISMYPPAPLVPEVAVELPADPVVPVAPAVWFSRQPVTVIVP